MIIISKEDSSPIRFRVAISTKNRSSIQQLEPIRATPPIRGHSDSRAVNFKPCASVARCGKVLKKERREKKEKTLVKGVLNPVDEFIRDRERKIRRPRRLTSAHRQATEMVSTPREREKTLFDPENFNEKHFVENKESTGCEHLLSNFLFEPNGDIDLPYLYVGSLQTKYFQECTVFSKIMSVEF